MKIGCVVRGLEKSSYTDHVLLSVARADTWAKFIKELETIDVAKKSSDGTISGGRLNLVGDFKGKCRKCGQYGHKAAQCTGGGPSSTNSGCWICGGNHFAISHETASKEYVTCN